VRQPPGPMIRRPNATRHALGMPFYWRVFAYASGFPALNCWPGTAPGLRGRPEVYMSGISWVQFPIEQRQRRTTWPMENVLFLTPKGSFLTWRPSHNTSIRYSCPFETRVRSTEHR
jgi:hypothetical protein